MIRYRGLRNEPLTTMTQVSKRWGYYWPTGLSAQAIAGGGNDHPWDPSDLLRCTRYCADVGITTDELRTRMTGRSVSWDRLLPEWDDLLALLRHEMATRIDGNAPHTYRAMKRVLDGGTKCPTCDGTGDGDPCTKCKGTGRRNGGRCRAKGCDMGAQRCPTCHGVGYAMAR